MKKPAIISLSLDFVKEKPTYHGIYHLANDIGLLYSIKLSLQWQKYKDIRIRVYNKPDEKLIVDNHGYKTRICITSLKNLSQLKIAEPTNDLKISMLDLLHGIFLELDKTYNFDVEGLNNAYDEVLRTIKSGEPLPNYRDIFFKENWSA